AYPQIPVMYFDTASDAESLVRRPSDPTDNASPSGASSVTAALLTASALVEPERSTRYRQAAEQGLARSGLLAERAPRFAGHWLSTAEAVEHGPLQVAVVGNAGSQVRSERVTAARTPAAVCGVGGAVAHGPGAPSMT